MRRLICPYPPNKKVGRILGNLGEDYGLDEIHRRDDTAEASGDELSEADFELPIDSDGALSEAAEEEEFDTAVAEADTPSAMAVVRAESRAVAAGDEPTGSLGAEQAEMAQEIRVTIAALEAALGSLKATGTLKGVHALEADLQQWRRRERELLKTCPAVAETFLRMRRAEAEEYETKKELARQMRLRQEDAARAIKERDAAVAEVKKAKRQLAELESARQCKYACKSFDVDDLGAGDAKAGGAKAKKLRHEVLDRLSHLNQGLSPAQRNDFAWWKDAWDEAMVAKHKANWAETFSGWVQTVVDDPASNAFSQFMYAETVRVLQTKKALSVPGG